MDPHANPSHWTRIYPSSACRPPPKRARNEEGVNTLQRYRQRNSAVSSSRGGPLGALVEREHTGHGGAEADIGLQRDAAAMQLDEGTHERKPKPGAAVMRAQRIRLEPVEHPVLHVRRDAWAAIGDREHHGIRAPYGRERNDAARRREAHGIG